MPHSSAIVPASGPLSWGSITGKPVAAPATVAGAPERTITIEGRVMKHGEMRQVTRGEEIAATYGLSQADPYESRTIDQIAAVDRIHEAWQKHLENHKERPDYHTGKEAIETVSTDVSNIASFLGNVLFG